MIEINNLSKSFGSVQAVNNLCLKVEPGELLALLGPNGAGKTTTIKILSGLLHPDSGRASICGFDSQSQGAAARASLSYVPDEPYLYPKLTAREFLTMVGRLYNMEPDFIAEEINILSRRLDFTSYIDQLAAGYSHGMRQRVVIAAAILHKPKALIIDEPVVGLDPRSTHIVKDILRELLAKNVAILMSTHTLPVAEEVATRIGIINKGSLIAIGTLAAIKKSLNSTSDLETIFLNITEANNNT